MSKYLDRFREVSGLESAYELIGDCLIVERIKPGETKIGSIIMATPDNYKSTFMADQPTFVKVLAVGKGYYNEETKESIPLGVEPGDVVLVPANSVKWFSTFIDMGDYEVNSIGLTREGEIQMRFAGEAGYNKVRETLSKHAEAAAQKKKQETL